MGVNLSATESYIPLEMPPTNTIQRSPGDSRAMVVSLGRNALKRYRIFRSCGVRLRGTRLRPLPALSPACCEGRDVTSVMMMITARTCEGLSALHLDGPDHPYVSTI